MNYKKISLLLVAGASIILAGCGNSAKDMTFDETYNAFRESHTSEALQMFDNLSNASALAEKGTYNISGYITSGVNANIAINADSVIANSGMNSESNVAINGQLSQPGVDDTITLDSNIILKMVSGESYINFSKLSLTSLKGNPQISMIGAFTAILTNKWISLSASGSSAPATLQGLSLSSLYSLPAIAVNSIKENKIFVETSKEMVDGNPVYRIGLSASGLYMVAKDMVNNDAIKAFLNGETFTDAELQEWANTFVANAAFDGTLTAFSKDNIVLTINSLRLDEAEVLKGTVEQKKSHFEVNDATAVSGSVVLLMDIESKGKSSVFSLSAPNQSLAVNGTIDLSKTTSDTFEYVLALIASHPSFVIDVDGNVEVKKIDSATVTAPETFQTLDQLLGGLDTLLGTQMVGTETLPTGDAQ